MIIDEMYLSEIFDLIYDDTFPEETIKKIRRLVAKEVSDNMTEVERRNFLLEKLGYKETMRVLGKGAYK